MNVMENIWKSQKKMKKNSKKGFTLVELIVVIAIIAVLAALLVPQLTKYLEDANDSRGYANARQIYTAGAALGASLMTTGSNVNSSYNTSNNNLSQYMSTNFTGYGLAEMSTTSGAVVEATWWTGDSQGSGKWYGYPSMANGTGNR